MDFLAQYGIFLAQTVTLVIAILAVVSGIVAISAKSKAESGTIELTDLSKGIEQTQQQFAEQLMNKEQLK